MHRKSADHLKVTWYIVRFKTNIVYKNTQGGGGRVSTFSPWSICLKLTVLTVYPLPILTTPQSVIRLFVQKSPKSSSNSMHYIIMHAILFCYIYNFSLEQSCPRSEGHWELYAGPKNSKLQRKFRKKSRKVLNHIYFNVLHHNACKLFCHIAVHGPDLLFLFSHDNTLN